MIKLVPVATVLDASRGVRPAPIVDARDSSQMSYWSNRLSVPGDKLAEAIEKVGPSIAAIRRHLGK